MKKLITLTVTAFLSLTTVACSQSNDTAEPQLTNAEKAERAQSEEMLDAPVSSSDIDTKSE